MSGNLIETLMGAVVLVVAAAFTVFAYQSADISASTGYDVTAKFETVDGLSLGSDVRVGGIKVGSVTRQSLDAQTYRAIITMNIQSDVPLPKDSSAAIVSDGLLGSKFVSIAPGAEETMLASGDSIDYTQSSVNLETLIGKFMFSDGGVENEGSSGKSETEPAPGSLLGE